MTPVDLINTSLTVNAACVPLSLAAVYAIMSDKFILPAVDRASGLTAKFRADVSTILADTVRQFVQVNTATAAEVKFYDPHGAPLENARIEAVQSVDSETFRESVRACLDKRSSAFDQYWASRSITHRLRRFYYLARKCLCLWPAFTVAFSGYFGACKFEVIYLPNIVVLWLLSAISVSPLLVFIGLVFLISIYAERADRLDTP